MKRRKGGGAVKRFFRSPLAWWAGWPCWGLPHVHRAGRGSPPDGVVLVCVSGQHERLRGILPNTWVSLVRRRFHEYFKNCEIMSWGSTGVGYRGGVMRISTSFARPTTRVGAKKAGSKKANKHKIDLGLVWRPTLRDIEAISRGDAAKRVRFGPRPSSSASWSPSPSLPSRPPTPLLTCSSPPSAAPVAAVCATA